MEPDLKKFFTGKPLISNDEIQTATKRLAKQISNNCKAKGVTPVLLCIDEGANMFLEALKTHLNAIEFKYEVAHVRVKSYSHDKSTGTVVISDYSGPNLKGRHVIVVEDIIDTSLSMKKVTEYLTNLGVASQAICVLFFKKRLSNLIWRLFDLESVFGYPKVLYIGMFIANLFIVGFGLDYRGYCRELLGIWVLTKEAKEYIDQFLG